MKIPDNATHFSVNHVTNTMLINFIPNDWVSDYHLDSYCIVFYCEDQELWSKKWVGIDSGDLVEGVKYPISFL